jgi:hypothetical protein
VPAAQPQVWGEVLFICFMFGLFGLIVAVGLSPIQVVQVNGFRSLVHLPHCTICAGKFTDLAEKSPSNLAQDIHWVE